MTSHDNLDTYTQTRLSGVTGFIISSTMTRGSPTHTHTIYLQTAITEIHLAPCYTLDKTYNHEVSYSYFNLFRQTANNSLSMLAGDFPPDLGALASDPRGIMRTGSGPSPLIFGQFHRRWASNFSPTGDTMSVVGDFWLQGRVVKVRYGWARCPLPPDTRLQTPHPLSQPTQPHGPFGLPDPSLPGKNVMNLLQWLMSSGQAGPGRGSRELDPFITTPLMAAWLRRRIKWNKMK